MSGEIFVCLDCHQEMELNEQGRCSICNSDAVDSVERLTPIQKEESNGG